MVISAFTMKGGCWPSLPKVSTGRRWRYTNVGGVRFASIFMAAFKPNHLPPLFTAELLPSDDDNTALQMCELISVSSNFFKQPLKNPVTSTTKQRQNVNNFL